MKTCGNCGHENSDIAVHCGECGWAVPPLNQLHKAGRILKRVAAIEMIALAVAHFVIIPFFPVGEGLTYEFLGLQSWFVLLLGVGVGAFLFWLGDFLTRTY